MYVKNRVNDVRLLQNSAENIIQSDVTNMSELRIQT